MSKFDPAFKLSNFNIEDLSQVTIEDASEGLSFGRRFKMKDKDNACSEALLLRDIFDEVKKEAKQSKNDRRRLEALNGLLGRLSQADTDANTVYDGKDGLYHFLTNFSRLFSFGSHSKRIGNLQNWITKKMDNLDPAKLFANLSGTENDLDLGDLAEELFEVNEYDLCIETIKKISPIYAKETNLLVKIADSYIDTDPDKALETIKLATKKDDRTDAVVTKLAQAHYNNNELDKTLEVIQEARIQLKEAFISKVADRYFLDEEYEKGVATIEHVVSAIYLKENFIKKTIAHYIANEDYQKAFELLPKYGARKIDFALSLAEKWHANNDYDKACEAIHFATNQGHFATAEKLRYMTLIKQVVTALCEANRPETALDLITPIKVDQYDRQDFSQKNALAKQILEAYIAQDRLDEAITIIDDDLIYQDFRMDNEILMNIAKAYYAKGDKPQAIDTLNKCNRLHYRTEIQALMDLYSQ